MSWGELGVELGIRLRSAIEALPTDSGVFWIAVVFGIVVLLLLLGRGPSGATSTQGAQDPHIDLADRSDESLKDWRLGAAPRVRHDPASASIPAASPDEPVSVTGEAPPFRTFAIPHGPDTGEARWFPLGYAVSIAGTEIPGGMVYVGGKLPTPNGTNDPALVNPALPVARRGDYRLRTFGYWPSYSEISPADRRAYLEWLAGGRKDPQADIGYVFLFYYGLERRVLLDAPVDPIAQSEMPWIGLELRRLLGIYGANSSFRRYATKLLPWIEHFSYPSRLYTKPLPAYEPGEEMPLHLRLVLGQCAVDKVPVPVNVAVAWARCEPSIVLRTPAKRCPREFEALFRHRYHERFGEGLSLAMNKTKLQLSYRPASAGLMQYKRIELTYPGIPDVSVQLKPVQELRALVETVTEELASYSRYLGSNPNSQSTLDALLLLPAQLWPGNIRAKLEDLRSRADTGLLRLRLTGILGYFDESSPLNRQRVTGLARALEAFGMGLEPDVLAGARLQRPEEPIVVFRTTGRDLQGRRTTEYRLAVLTVELAMAVAQADDAITLEEFRHLNRQIESWDHLSQDLKQRLRAHMRLLMDAPVTIANLRRKLEAFPPDARSSILRFLVSLAHVDGTVSPTEVKVLERFYRMLGLEVQQLYAALHETADSRTGSGSSSEPAAHTPQGAAASGLGLNKARVAELREATEEVSELLASIFVDESEAVPPSSEALVPAEDEDVTDTAPLGLAGLDATHATFVRMLVSRPTWSREELLDVAGDLNLMLDGALIHVNEACIDAHELPLVEGNDILEVNKEILDKEFE